MSVIEQFPAGRCKKCAQSYMAKMDDHSQRGERLCSWFGLTMTCRRGKTHCGAPPDGYKKGEG